MDGVERPQNSLSYEERFWSRGFSRVAGVDEVGRGPLAGPVVAAAVILLPAEEIIQGAAFYGLGAASVGEIDHLNILVATRLAMTRALAQLPQSPDHVVVDGLPMKGLEWEHDAVVGGDGTVHSIACASILAKVVRDRLMASLAVRYPGYGWETNMGYGTAQHREALERMGPTPHHRLTFGGVQMDLGI